MSFESVANNAVSSELMAEMLGFSDGVSGEALSIYDFIYQPIREADASEEGRLFLKRFLAGPQVVWNEFNARAQSLPDLWSITKCPADALQYLKVIAGWTRDLDYITDRLDELGLRRLLLASPAIWRERGGEDAWVEVVALLTAARSMVVTWHDVRYIVDESALTEDGQGFDTWLFEAPGDDRDEFYSNIRIVDDGAGTLDRQLVLDVLGLLRPVGERILVSWVQFLDEFIDDGDRSQWDDGVVSATTDGFAVADDVATLTDTAIAESVFARSTLSSQWTDVNLYARVKGTGVFGVSARATDDDNLYKVAVNIATNRVELIKRVAGVETTLASAVPVVGTLFSDVYYGLRLDAEAENFRVYLDGDLVIDTTDATFSQGTCGLWHNVGATVTLDTFEVAPAPMDSYLIEP